MAQDNQSLVDEIINEMKEEGQGSRGVFYENFGSGIQASLLPLAELLEVSREAHPALVEQVAIALERGY